MAPCKPSFLQAETWVVTSGISQHRTTPVTRRQALDFGITSSGSIVVWIPDSGKRFFLAFIDSLGLATRGISGCWPQSFWPETAYISHDSAGALIGLDGIKSGSVELTVRTRRNNPGIKLHYTKALQPMDVGRVAGIPVTSPTRTLVDLAPPLDEEILETALDARRKPSGSPTPSAGGLCLPGT